MLIGEFTKSPWDSCYLSPRWSPYTKHRFWLTERNVTLGILKSRFMKNFNFSRTFHLSRFMIKDRLGSLEYSVETCGKLPRTNGHVKLFSRAPYQLFNNGRNCCSTCYACREMGGEHRPDRLVDGGEIGRCSRVLERFWLLFATGKPFQWGSWFLEEVRRLFKHLMLIIFFFFVAFLFQYICFNTFLFFL